MLGSAFDNTTRKKLEKVPIADLGLRSGDPLDVLWQQVLVLGTGGSLGTTFDANHPLNPEYIYHAFRALNYSMNALVRPSAFDNFSDMSEVLAKCRVVLPLLKFWATLYSGGASSAGKISKTLADLHATVQMFELSIVAYTNKTEPPPLTPLAVSLKIPKADVDVSIDWPSEYTAEAISKVSGNVPGETIIANTNKNIIMIFQEAKKRWKKGCRCSFASAGSCC